MPSAATLERFIAKVEANQHVDAIAEFYAAHASMQENNAPPRIGRDMLMAHEQRAMDRTARVVSTCVRPALVSGDTVVIRWIFEFTGKDGSTARIEELAYQHWEGELITQEQFFYDPKQFVASPATA